MPALVIKMLNQVIKIIIIIRTIHIKMRTNQKKIKEIQRLILDQ
jgi:hypothetical protein